MRSRGRECGSWTQNSIALHCSGCKASGVLYHTQWQKQAQILPTEIPPTTEVKPGLDDAHNNGKLMRIDVNSLSKGWSSRRCAPLNKGDGGAPVDVMKAHGGRQKSSNNWREGCTGPKDTMHVPQKRKNDCPCRNSNPASTSPWSSQYTNQATPIQFSLCTTQAAEWRHWINKHSWDEGWWFVWNFTRILYHARKNKLTWLFQNVSSQNPLPSLRQINVGWG
jgi:hypothetical protein